MTPLTIVVVAFVLALVLFGFAFWTPIYALPVAVLFLLAFGLAHTLKRTRPSSRWQAERNRASHAGAHHENDFTQRDHETLYDRH